METNINDLRKQVLTFLKKNKGRSFKINELQKLLNLDSEQRSSLRKNLYQLTHRNEISSSKTKRYKFKQIITTIQSKIEVNPRGNGFAVIEKTGEKIFVPERFLKTAMNGDLVEIELLAPSVKTGKSREGKVIRILENTTQRIVGTFQKSRKFNFVIPDDNRVRRDIYIDWEEEMGAESNDKVVVELYGWEHEKVNPTGKVVEILGKADAPGIDVLSVARSYEISERFPKEVEEEAQKISTKISQKEIASRMDLRDLVCFTIDPFDAKDFDDAISLEILENGNFEVGVHIADVSHYVKEESFLDKEAFKRGTSTYLVDRVIPMLPEKLSNELCSLRPNEDKLTYTCFIEVTKTGVIKNHKIGKSVIHSNRRFTYEEVQEIILGKENEFSEKIILMNKLAKIFIKKRKSSGSIDFETTEVKFKLDEMGKPVEAFTVPRLDAHRLVEEFMLLANRVVAAHIQDQKKKRILPFIYRTHDKPTMEKVKDLVELVRALGYEVEEPKNITPKAFAKIVEAVKGSSEEFVINEIAIRSMMKAIYSEINIGHFGLAFKNYTHFTSPIRRYPDLIVHRCLFEYEKLQGKLNEQRYHKLNSKLVKICKQASERERNALEAERKSIAIKKVEFIENYVGEEFEAKISGVTEFGIFCQIIQFGVEGLVHIRHLNDDYYKFDEKQYRLIGETTGKIYRLGDFVQIKVTEVDHYGSKIDFLLVQDENETVRRKPRKKSSYKKRKRPKNNRKKKSEI